MYDCCWIGRLVNRPRVCFKTFSFRPEYQSKSAHCRSLKKATITSDRIVVQVMHSIGAAIKPLTGRICICEHSDIDNHMARGMFRLPNNSGGGYLKSILCLERSISATAFRIADEPPIFLLTSDEQFTSISQGRRSASLRRGIILHLGHYSSIWPCALSPWRRPQPQPGSFT